MSLLHPLWLWSLAGLLLPLAIHLLSRKEGNVIRIGSIRHLQETSTQQFKGIRLNEILLLLLRSAMVVLLCLLLAGLMGTFQPRDKWVLAETGTEHSVRGRALLDSLTAQGYEPHRWSSGLPAWETDYTVEPASYYRWMAELKDKHLAEAVVITWQYASGFTGPAVAVPDRIRVVTVEPSRKPFVENAMQFGDSVRLVIGHPDAFGVRYEVQTSATTADSVKVSAQKKLTVRVIADDAHKEQAVVLAAAWRALSTLDWQVEVSNSWDPQQKMDWLVWLREESAPETDAMLLTVGEEAQENILVKVAPRHYAVQKLTAESAYQGHLVTALAALVSEAKSSAHTQLPDAWAWPREGVDSTHDEAALSSWLLMAVVALLALERWISFKRKQ